MTNPTPPEGWVMALREAECLLTGYSITGEGREQPGDRVHVLQHIRKVLAAAPTPPPAGQSLESDPGTGRQDNLSDRLLKLVEAWEKEAEVWSHKALTGEGLLTYTDAAKSTTLRHAAQQVREALKND